MKVSKRKKSHGFVIFLMLLFCYSWVMNILFSTKISSNTLTSHSQTPERADNAKGNAKAENSGPPLYNDVVLQIHKWTTNGPNEDSENILMVVSHRELLFACHSFEEFLSPRYHTLFLFPEDLAKGLAVDEVVQNATHQTSEGAHLFFTDGYAGNGMSRYVGEKFAAHLESIGFPIDYLVVANCDVHQLPQEHDLFVPTDTIIQKMVQDFELAKEYRQTGKFLEVNYDKDGNTPCPSRDLKLGMPKNQMDLLAMNTVLWESVPDMKRVEVFHGADPANWQSKTKPERLIQKSLPWLYDVSEFFENHMVMYDLKVLRRIKQIAPSWISSSKVFVEEQENTGTVANYFNMTIVRNNDVSFHLSFSASNQNPVRVNVNWVRGKSFELIGEVSAPKYDFHTQIEGYRVTGVSTMSMINPWKVALCTRMNRTDWLPNNGELSGTPLVDGNMRMIVEGILKYFGYVEKRGGKSATAKAAHRYELDGAFPGNRVLRFSQGLTPNDETWTRILSIGAKDQQLWTLYMCNCLRPECSLKAQLNFTDEERKQRSVEIPLENSTMEAFHISEGCSDHVDGVSPFCCYNRYSSSWELLERNMDKYWYTPLQGKEAIHEVLEQRSEL